MPQHSALSFDLLARFAKSKAPAATARNCLVRSEPNSSKTVVGELAADDDSEANVATDENLCEWTMRGAANILLEACFQPADKNMAMSVVWLLFVSRSYVRSSLCQFESFIPVLML